MTTIATAHEHHPVMHTFIRRPATSEPEVHSDFLGVRTRTEFQEGSTASTGDAPLPAFDEEYFEWVDVLAAVREADDEFVMVELGAGYGRWSIRAAAAVKQKPGCRFRCIAVEAEPAHFRWMRQHFKDNGLVPSDHDLIWAAVGPTPGFVPFWVGDSSQWYGQAVATHTDTLPPDARTRRKLRARSALGRPPVVSHDTPSVLWVPCVTLAELISPYPYIDLLDIDIQGHEYDVLASSIDLLTERVRRIHIGTHSRQIEHDLRALFAKRGWKNLNDYPSQSRVETPYGEVSFGDGVQTWLNLSAMPARRLTSARRLRADGHHNEALEAFLPVIAGAEAAPDLVLETAETAEGAHRFDVAAGLYTRLLTRTPRAWRGPREQLLTYRLGSLLARLGQTAGALRRLRRALRCPVSDPPIAGAAHFHIGELLRMNGHAAEARTHYALARQYIPTHARASDRLAELSAGKRDDVLLVG
jgi:FkbM family methyltransferase